MHDRILKRCPIGGCDSKGIPTGGHRIERRCRQLPVRRVITGVSHQKCSGCSGGNTVKISHVPAFVRGHSPIVVTHLGDHVPASIYLDQRHADQGTGAQIGGSGKLRTGSTLYRVA